MLIETIGAAVVAFSVAGASLTGSTLHVATRNQEPTRLDVVDLSTARLLDSQPLPAGDGAWAVTAAPDGVWVGTFGAAGEENLVRYADGAIRETFRLPNLYVWDLATGPDGTVVGALGTPGGSVELATEDRTPIDTGLIAGDELGRATAVVGDRTVVGGSVGPTAVLYADDGARGRRSVLPPGLADDQQVYAVAAAGEQVVIGTVGPARQDPAVALIDLDDPTEALIARASGEDVIDQVLSHRGQVWATARPSGALYRLDAGAGRLVQVAVPRRGAETRTLEVRDERILGVAADGAVWEHHLATGLTSLTEPSALGLRPDPQLAQSLAAGDGTVWAGGNFAVQGRDLATGATSTAFVPGEPKDIVVADGTAYLAMYPIGEIWAVDGVGAQPRPVAELPDEQIRPQDLEVLPDGRLAVTTTDDFSSGALSIVDPATGEVTTIVEPLGPGQTPTGLLVHDGLLLVGATGTPAAVAAIDPATLEVIWQIDDAALGGGFINGLTAADDLVVAITSRGEVIVIDPTSAAVLRRGEVADGVPGRAVSAQVGPIVATYTDVLSIDPATATTTPLVTGTGSQVFGYPPLAVDEDGVAYAIEGRDIIAISGGADRGEAEGDVDPVDRGQADTTDETGRPAPGGPVEEEGLSQPTRES